MVRSSPSSLSSGETGDMVTIRGARDFCKQFWVESKRVWRVAGPAIFISVCHFSLTNITQMFVGHLGALELAAFSVQNNIIAYFSFGLLLGMGSALETLCGQAYGAGQLDMMGLYLQRSWVILNVTALLLSPLYIFSGQFFRLIGLSEDIAKAAGKFSLYMIPQLFTNAMYFPITNFLQSQSKMVVMAVMGVVTLASHVFFSWLLILRVGWGLKGAAVALNASYLLLVVAQLTYIVGGACGKAWTGFSWKAFHSLCAFVRLSVASAVMLCLELWYFVALLLFAGHLQNPKVSLDGLSICMNILSWTVMVGVGFNMTGSVRVSNELGADHPRTAKFSVVVVVIYSFVIGVILSLALIISRKQYPAAFTNNKDVKNIVYALTPLLAVSIIVNNVQPVLSGIAVGAGWQAMVAYVNIGCLYVFGLPLGILMGYKLGLGVKGIWYGMLSGTATQTIILIWMTYRTDWKKEASIAGERIRHWGGQTEERIDKQTEG